MPGGGSIILYAMTLEVIHVRKFFLRDTAIATTVMFQKPLLKTAFTPKRGKNYSQS